MGASDAERAANVGKSVDDILTWGADGGIEYFVQFYPLYTQMYTGPYKSKEELEARYDEQRGMNLTKLAGTRDALAVALKEAQTQLQTQQNCATRLQQVWSGGSASSTAHAMVADQVKYAGADVEAAQKVVDAMSAMITQVHDAVVDKASLVYHIPATDGGKPKFEIDHRSPSDIQTMIDICKAQKWVSKAQVQALDGWFADRAIIPYTEHGNDTWYKDDPKDENSISENPGKITQISAQYWMDKIFKPEVDSRLGIFDNACTTTDNTINQSYKLVTDAMNAVHDTRYPRPATQNAAPAPAPSPSPSPSPSKSTTTASTTTDDSGDKTTTTSPTKNNNTNNSNSNNSNLSTTLSSLASQASSLTSTASSALNGLGSTLNSVVTQGESAISALSGQIEKGIDGVLKSASGASGASGKSVAEFDIAGKHVKLGLGVQGGLSLDLSDTAGEDKTYTLKLDEHGMPVISTEDHGASGPHGTSDTQAASGSHSTSDSHSSSGSQSTSESQGASGSSSSTSSDSGSQATNHSSSEQNSATEQIENKTPSLDTGTSVNPGTATQKDQSKSDQAKNQTTPSPTKPFDSGAELSEAGPL